jgi:hypothetical protein
MNDSINAGAGAASGNRTLAELRDALKKLNIKGCSGLKKDELLMVLREHEQQLRAAEVAEAADKDGADALVSAAAAVLRASSKRRSATPQRRERSSERRLRAALPGSANDITVSEPPRLPAPGARVMAARAAIDYVAAGRAPAGPPLPAREDEGRGVGDSKLLNDCVRSVRRTHLEKYAAGMAIERSCAKKKRALLDEIIEKTISDKLTEILAISRNDQSDRGYETKP